MSKLFIEKFGGLMPIITDPLLLPDGRSQAAKNCRFDLGGVQALLEDLAVSTPTNPGPLLSLFLYQFVGKFLAWNSNVTAAQAPLANDEYNRIYYTEGGALKVTDSTLYDQAGTSYPMASLNPSPPAPAAALVATANGIPPTKFIGIYRVNLQGTAVQITYPGPPYNPLLSNINPNTPITFYGTGIPALDNQTFNFDDITYDGNENVDLTINSGDGNPITSLMGGAIQAITKANPGVVTSAGHNLITGDVIQFTTTGMTQLNNVTATVTVINANSFSIGIDTTAYTTFATGSWSLTQRLSAVFAPSYITISTGTSDSISNANPANVKHNAHGLSTGTTIEFGDMQGMTQLNGVVARITVVDANNFTLDNIDSTAYGAFVSGIYGIFPSFSLVEDPTKQISVYYTETYVDQYGSEGPPAPVSNIVSIYDGDTVTLADTNTASPGAQYAIVSKNLYKSSIDASGNEQLQFLANIPLAQASYSDSTLAAALGVLLPSAEWDGPPTGITGLVAMANQVLAAFSGNLFLLCVPGFFHAWPASYQQPTDTPIMGIGAFGTTAIVLTQGIPYLATFTDPSNVVMDKMGAGYGCVSQRSVVQMGGPVFYAAPDGLIAMTPSGAQILTEKLISPEKWQSQFYPSTISGYYWKGYYVGFYNNTAGFMLHASTGELINLDFYATAGYHDPVTGNLYLVVDGQIVAFAAGATQRSMILTGKRYRFHLTTYSWIKVIAAVYPVNFTITYYNSTGGVTASFPLTAVNSRPFKHPRMNMQDQCDVTITDSVTAILLAGAIEELPE